MAEITSDTYLTHYKVTLEPDEEVHEVIPKHWGSLLWPILGLATVAILTIFAMLFSSIFIGPASLIGSYWFLIALVYVALFIYGFSEWHNYRHSALVITAKRVIDCHQINFLARRVQTIDIYEIQSCSGTVSPGWGTLLNYGRLCINTIGDQSIFVHNVPSPELVSNQIMHYHNLIAHGGVEAAHNPQSEEKIENRTSQLTQLSKPVETVAQQEIEQSEATPADWRAPPEKATLLLFRIASTKLGKILAKLPTQPQPQLTYHQQTDDFEVELMVPAAESQPLNQELERNGVKNVIKRPIAIDN